ncbi:MAG: hypothetical protein IJP44_09985 [Bacteroidales bacterium]|nr:hypothetical protein [Bacteroidales bacterium]
MTFTRENYPEAYEYLGIGTKPGEDTQLSCDIETLTERLPLLVTLSDEDKSLANANIEISYIIRNLQRVRDELRQKGGAE